MAEYEGPKPITTFYKGYRFRSRLEARWAVLLDTLGIEYEYEKEGFDLGSGLRYLPDFYLPKQSTWLEIKGQLFAPYDETWRKACALALETTEPVVVFVGQIAEQPGNLWGSHFWGTEDETTGHAPLRVWWFRCPICKQWDLGPNVYDLPCGCLQLSPSEQPDLWTATRAARQARFEFGEKG